VLVEMIRPLFAASFGNEQGWNSNGIENFGWMRRGKEDLEKDLEVESGKGKRGSHVIWTFEVGWRAPEIEEESGAITKKSKLFAKREKKIEFQCARKACPFYVRLTQKQ
jgi:hypothetical protein